MRRSALLLVFVAALLGAGSAAADTVTIPPGTGLPWTDPAHHSPLEQLAARAASMIAGRPNISVDCEGQTDWNTLTAQIGEEPGNLLGYVPWSFAWENDAWYIASDADLVQLAPPTCWYLQQFAEAATKPTKCRPLVIESSTVYVTQRYRAAVRRRVGGRWVRRYVWRMRRAARTVSQDVPGAFAPCWGTAGVVEPAAYWADFASYAQALWTLAHESIHLTQGRAGALVSQVMPSSETDANCFGLQWLPRVAVMLGDTPDDAERIAQYAYVKLYPGYQGESHNGSPYWSADCRPGGPLDLTPSDGVWP